MKTRKVTKQIGGAEVTLDYGSNSDHWPHTNDERTSDIVPGDKTSWRAKDGDVLRERKVETEDGTYVLHFINPHFYRVVSQPESDTADHGMWQTVDDFKRHLDDLKKRETNAR